MYRSSLIVAGAALLCSTATAQHSLDPARKVPITAQPKYAGKVDVTTGQWTAPGAASKKAVITVFNNTCTWSVTGYYGGLTECEDGYDEGQIPSTGNNLWQAAWPAGTGVGDSQVVDSFQIHYCTYNATSSGPIDIEIVFYDKLNGDCVGGIPPTGAGSHWSRNFPGGGGSSTGPAGLLYAVPGAASTTAYFDLAGIGLPGSTTAGTQACWVVDIDVSNTGFSLQSDGDGFFDNLGSEDKFIWGRRFNSVTPVTSPNGFVISGDPGYAANGTCSYNIPCATDAIYGNPCGTGWGANDNSWINVDGVGSFQTPQVPPVLPAAPCPPGVAAYGYGTNCYFWGGYPTNPFDSYHLVINADPGGGGCGQFCASKPSSIPNCTPTLTCPGGSVSKSGSPAFVLTASPVPGGGGKPGIVIYTKNGVTGSPINTPFGELCLNQFLRAGALPGTPGGTSGSCNGTYNFNFAAIAAFYNQIKVGDTIHAQAWYRDPANPGTANFTNGVGPFNVIP